MEKGKHGIVLSFYATTAFLLAILGQTMLCGLLLGLVIVAEDSEWTVRQVIQAFCLSFISGLGTMITGAFGAFSAVPFLGMAITGVFGLISGVISIIVLVFSIIAIVHVCKGKEADVPLANKFAHWAYGQVTKKVVVTEQPQGTQNQ